MRWIPKGPGKGGTFTNATYHDMDPESTWQISGCVVDVNAWRLIYNSSIYGSTFGIPVGNISSIEIFNRYSGVSQTLTSNVVAGHTIGGSFVWNHTTAALIRSAATPMPLGAGGGRFCFAPVKNRLYMANGTDPPAICTDASVSSCIPWGFSPQVPNLTYQIAAPGTGTNAGVLGGTQGTCNTTNVANSVVTWVSGPKFDYFVMGATIYINGVYHTIATWVSTTSVTLADNAGLLNGVPFSYAPAGITGNANYTIGAAPFVVWTGPPFIVGAAGVASVPPAGAPQFVAGAVTAGVTPTVKYALSAVTAVAAGTINPVFIAATGTYNTQINMGNITFDSGRAYNYAVSYYNPTSGHTSNTSAILNVKDGAPNNANVTVTISNIICTNDTNYTRIILWRSPVNSATLYPLAILTNNSGNAAGNTITYTDILGDDTALGTATGSPGKTPGPNGLNIPPPVDLNYIAYWDGRFWGAPNGQIGILAFSARSSATNEDISIGVAEECWPPTFTRSIPEADGRITGLRTVANNLFVLTDNNIYAVVGGSKTNYGLTRISGKGHGTSHFNTTILPSEDSNSSDVLVHMGNDKRLYFLFGSGGDYQISYPVQNYVTNDTVNFVGVQHTVTSTYVIVGLNNNIMLYDVERKLWSFFGAIQAGGATAYCEGLINGVVTQLIAPTGAAGVSTFKLEIQTPPPNLGMSIYTNQFSPGGERKDDKTLEAVAVYYTNRTDAIAVAIGRDSPLNTPTDNLTEVPNTGQYAAYFENPDARIFMPQGTMARGRLFQIGVIINILSGFNSVYEIRALFNNSESPQMVGGNV